MSGDVCRVCGSTLRDRIARCGLATWVSVEPGSAPLCSDCAGTLADQVEALCRAQEQLAQLTNPGIAAARRIANAARLRRDARRMKENPGLARPMKTR